MMARKAVSTFVPHSATHRQVEARAVQSMRFVLELVSLQEDGNYFLIGIWEATFCHFR